ncbi:multiprotein-bridging factor 1 family protein [Kitasatospora sp. NPDC088783]|uniref:helix-turn-helix domain-containing protein n=1 Tax=Kitasatospora sp. NPDC088783 TaxID=3364077 RepID=UPI003814C329
MSDELFDSVDALLAAVPTGLPDPAERKRLRLAGGVTPAQVAAALRVNSSLVREWEDGSADPDPGVASAYARLLDGLAQRFPAPEPSTGAPAPAPQRERPAPAQPAAAVPQQVMLDQRSDGSLVMGRPAPCVQCGQPSVYRAQGRPMHLGGFCRPAAAAAGPAARPAAAVPAPAATAPAEPSTPAAVPAEPSQAPAAEPPARPRTKTTPRTPDRTSPKRPAGTAPAAGQRVAVVALDAADGSWMPDVPGFPAPAGPKLGDWFAWLGTGLPLRIDSPRPQGRGGDGTICLTAAALEQLGLPAALPTTDRALASLRAKMAKAAAATGMEISDTIGPSFHAFRRAGAAGGPKTSARIVVAPWLGQGSDRQQATNALALALATTPDGTPDGLTFARRSRAFITDLGVAPGATTASTAMLLLDAVRPRLAADKEPAADALPDGDLCVPQAAGARHPLTREQLSRREPVCREEDYTYWTRPLTPAETAAKYAVAVDVCASYLSVTATLPLPVGPLVAVKDPDWNKGKAGLWFCDFTGIAVDELLPHPATFDGSPPAGPDWYATPTVAHMADAYGFDPATITDALLSTHTAPLLKEWTRRLREGYKGAYAALGLSDDQSPEEFLAAYAVHKDVGADPVLVDALVRVGLYKGIYKGGIGKWADSARHLDDATWLETVAALWSYRPEIRLHIVAAARVAAHRRMRKTLQLTGRAPFALNRDSYLYTTDAPSPLELLTFKPDGTPVTGALRLGIAPGSHKHEASIPIQAIIEAFERDEHPCRLTHHYTTGGTLIEPEQDATSSTPGTGDQQEGDR